MSKKVCGEIFVEPNLGMEAKIDNKNELKKNWGYSVPLFICMFL